MDEMKTKEKKLIPQKLLYAIYVELGVRIWQKATFFLL